MIEITKDNGLPVKVHERIEELCRLTKLITESQYEFCKKYVQLIDDCESAKEILLQKGFPKEMLRRAEKIGRNMAVPECLTDRRSVVKRLMNCPKSEQEKYYNGFFEVLTVSGDVLRVQIDSLTPEQEKQVFTHDHVRDLGEQKNYMESLRKIESSVSVGTAYTRPYTVRKDKIVFNRPCELTKQEILNLLATM